MGQLGLTDGADEGVVEMIASRCQRGEGVLAQGLTQAAILEGAAPSDELRRRAESWLSEIEDIQWRMQQIVGRLSSAAQTVAVADWGGSAPAIWLENKCEQLETLLRQIEEDSELEPFVDWQRAEAIIKSCNLIFDQGADFCAALKERLVTEAWREAEVSNLVTLYSGEYTSSTASTAPMITTSNTITVEALALIAETLHGTEKLDNLTSAKGTTTITAAKMKEVAPPYIMAASFVKEELEDRNTSVKTRTTLSTNTTSMTTMNIPSTAIASMNILTVGRPTEEVGQVEWLVYILHGGKSSICPLFPAVFLRTVYPGLVHVAACLMVFPFTRLAGQQGRWEEGPAWWLGMINYKGRWGERGLWMREGVG
ncbi:hypothetical protein CBR_g41150 [Chara braunii]|uniref:Uncharacterized protein n=1 Tax=Chara braunii TaxID=69332 RepID=A0A388K2I4_CHABU|nr:hypothetical protein CBR_g41150 [Chara braunii]|eukprot:GBG64229.1 hypothetical protein CBR_g41150 [Chara braunii]